MKNETLSTISIAPEKTAAKCIIWLHGLGADGNDFAPIVPELRLPPHLNIKFVFPHAPIMPVSINNGYEMRAWFDISHDGISANVDHSGIKQSVAAINDLIKLENDAGITDDNIMLAGFSQGAVIALTAGILYPQRLAGIIALSGTLPDAATIIEHGAPANRNIPIFIAHGSQDQMVPATLGQATYHSLSQADYPAEWHSYPMAHSVSPEEIRDISQWIQKIWK